MLGRLGGKRRVPKGLALLDSERKSEIAREGAGARWDAYYASHPEALKVKLEREARKRRKRKAAKK